MRPAAARPLAVLFGLAPLAIVLIAAAWPDDPVKGIRILYPAPQSINAGAVRIIVAADLSAPTPGGMLDGKPLPLTRMTFSESWALPGKLRATSARVGDRSGCALYAAQASLTPGPHEIAAGDSKVKVFALKDAKAAVPAGTVRGSAHRTLEREGAKLDCSSCHQQIGGQLGAVDTPTVCAPCHNDTSVQLIHGHVPAPLGKCAMCHDPHGAPLPKLLVNKKEVLCAKCHGSGHFRG